MIEAMPSDSDEEPSYLDGGRIPEDAVAELFRAAEYLYRIAPWRVATDDQVVRIDIPDLGIEGACLSIIGALGESLGFLLFPSFGAYAAFREVAEDPPTPKGPIDFGTAWLALNFERGADLPAAMVGRWRRRKPIRICFASTATPPRGRSSSATSASQRPALARWPASSSGIPGASPRTR
jgi:hypothetical protein